MFIFVKIQMARRFQNIPNMDSPIGISVGHEGKVQRHVRLVVVLGKFVVETEVDAIESNLKQPEKNQSRKPKGFGRREGWRLDDKSLEKHNTTVQRSNLDIT